MRVRFRRSDKRNEQLRSVALALLTNQRLGVRDVARDAQMSPSTISRARRHLLEASLVDENYDPLVSELFWETSKTWSPSVTAVDTEPVGDGWVLAGDAAAAK